MVLQIAIQRRDAWVIKDAFWICPLSVLYEALLQKPSLRTASTPFKPDQVLPKQVFNLPMLVLVGLDDDIRLESYIDANSIYL